MAAALAGPLLALSPRLPQLADLAGDWILASGYAAPCRLQLEVTRAGKGRLAVPKTCTLPGVDLEAVTNWRPTTDGLALVQADGALVLFLDRIASETYTAALPDGSKLCLNRARPRRGQILAVNSRPST